MKGSGSVNSCFYKYLKFDQHLYLLVSISVIRGLIKFATNCTNLHEWKKKKLIHQSFYLQFASAKIYNDPKSATR